MCPIRGKTVLGCVVILEFTVYSVIFKLIYCGKRLKNITSLTTIAPI